MLIAASAHAEDAPQTALPDAGPVSQGSDIVVTAQKRNESIQRVPISLQALSSANLEQHQVQAFDDYAKQLPSVSFQSFGPGQSQLFFRGITSGGDGLPFGALPTSGVYLDETPVTTIGALLDVHIYDVARVEALSGPQGTLYGASSLSGTLRIITNKPDPSKFSGSIDLQGGKFGKGDASGSVEGYVNIPLNDRMALRAVGWYDHEGGYIDNTPKSRTYQRWHDDGTGTYVASPYVANNSAFVKNNFNDVDTYGGRVALGIDLDDDWTITPQLIGQYQKSHGSFLYDPNAGDLEVHDFAPEFNKDEWYQAALTVQGKVGDWDLLYSGGYMDRKIRTAADYSYYTVAYDALYPESNTAYFKDAAGNDINPTQYFSGSQNLTKQTHELRVNSPANKPFRMTAGLFYQRQTNLSTLSYYVPGISGNVTTDWWNGTTVYGDSIFLTRARIVDRDYAMFAQASYDITPSLTLTGGVRGFIYRNTLNGYSGFSFNAPDGCTVPMATLDACTNLDTGSAGSGKKATGSGETHKINLTWQIDPDHMVYATYSTGFRPGGNNRRASVKPYGPDTLDNFELGWKTSWLNRRLRFNGAVYYERWKDLQYALVLVGSGGVTNIYNAGNARVYGVEADIQAIPLSGLTLSVSGAYNNAALSTDFCAIGTDGNPDCSTGNIAAPKGTRLPVQPRIKITGTARYEFALGDVNAFMQGSVLRQSSSTSFLSVEDNATVGNSGGFTTADFAIGGSKNGTSVELFIQNAFDERGSLSHNVFTAPTTSGQFYRIYPVKPQYFGIKVGRKF
ncbi:TonB-dependent receptor [Sphingobium sp. Sx8-8]|uniref:TonB-dependent receptor n=1 Tax=Sphingobium sp. Sx8-8 TaxID=2933617 RepID=UPI001F579D54|nr:TonB-dependent receptor [Sphingobium sp. Sx8-8]